jgi:probable phosphoglycerate mutase
MTTFLLIRHGAHLLGGGIIAGRSADVRLSPLGTEQVRTMAERVALLQVTAIYSSPVERTRQTAEVLGSRLKLPVAYRDTLSEIDFGEWSGRRCAALDRDEHWRQWNSFRSGTRIPGGERMAEVQTRIVNEVLDQADRHPGGIVCLVSHGDVIKAAVAYFLGVPLDLMLRIEISLASVSVVRVESGGPWVLCVNSTGEIVME